MSFFSKSSAAFAAMVFVTVSSVAQAQTEPGSQAAPKKAPAGAAAPAPAAQRAAPAAPAAPPAPVGSDPTTTTAAFGDWVLRCVKMGDPAAPQRLCEVAQSIQVEGQQAPVAQVAMGRLKATDPLHFTLVLPNNVTLAAAPRVSSGEGDKQPVELSWQRSLPGGCFADVVMKDDVLAKWRGASGMGQITFADGAGRPVVLPFSLRGLAQSLDALAKN